MWIVRSTSPRAGQPRSTAGSWTDATGEAQELATRELLRTASEMSLQCQPEELRSVAMHNEEAEGTAGARCVGPRCGAPTDMHCPLCRKPLCFACAREHGASSAPLCSGRDAASAAAVRGD